jgi:hypothetical protein
VEPTASGLHDGEPAGVLVDLDADLVAAAVEPGGFHDVGGTTFVVLAGDDDLAVLPAGFDDYV